MISGGIAIGLATVFYRMANARGANGIKWAVLFIFAWFFSSFLFSFLNIFFQAKLTELSVSAFFWRTGVGLLAGALVYLLFELKMRNSE